LVQSVEIVCIGKELLIGKILNTNAQWLAKRLTSLGLNVRRITNVDDDIDEVSSALQEAMLRDQRFIITTEGLGPTFDDKTLEGLAEALECKLEINNEALKMVEEKYRKYVEEGRMEKVELTPPRVKMARLPQGAKPLFNLIGTAPGVLVEREGVSIVALPGVPSEMKVIFEESVLPLLKEAAGDVTFFEASLEATGVMESEVAPLIDEVMQDNPYVYVKSHPRGGEGNPRIEFHLSTTNQDSGVARNRVSKALVQLSELIQGKGGKIKPVKKED
jgi:molybdenum cofactor synthesis domain-containing protein